MSSQIHIDEAKRMLSKIRELGKQHENAKFLAREILADLKTAESYLHIEPASIQSDLKESIRKIRIDLLAYQFSL